MHWELLIDENNSDFYFLFDIMPQSHGRPCLPQTAPGTKPQGSSRSGQT